MKGERIMVSQLNIINTNEPNMIENDVGGDWACILGCGSFCFIFAGSASYIATVTTAL